MQQSPETMNPGIQQLGISNFKYIHIEHNYDSKRFSKHAHVARSHPHTDGIITSGTDTITVDKQTDEPNVKCDCLNSDDDKCAIYNIFDPHFTLDKFQYDFYDEKFTDVDLKQHTALHRSQGVTKKTIPCIICDRRFHDRANLLDHINIHTGETPYTCIACENAFADAASLLNHIRKHKREYPCNCEKCLKDFSDSDLCKGHICRDVESCRHCHDSGYKYDTQPKSDEFSCEHFSQSKRLCGICGQFFSSEASLKSHMPIHRENKIPCEFCEREFVYITSYRNHVAMHRIYICGICQEDFGKASALIDHMNKHADGQYEETRMQLNDEYVCGICDRHFQNSYTLIEHMTVHFDGKDSDTETRWISVKHRYVNSSVQ